MAIGYAHWRKQKYLLNKLTLRGLIKAYVTYPAIQVYFLLFIACCGLTVYLLEEPLPVVAAVALAALTYPLVWYLLHRFVLHGRVLYKSPRTAALWKRIHYDHHQHPNDLSVLFGGLHTTLPTIAVVTIGTGWLVAGPVGAAAAFATGLITTCFYEFCHCIQHLKYAPKLRFLQRIKRLHLAHHFHNENGNYGITNFFWDRILASYYDKPNAVPRSPTVRNLGYAGAEREIYPWVADLSAEPENG